VQESELSALVRPSGEIPEVVSEKTGITNEMVADTETIDQVLPQVVALVGDAPIVAHNAHFDRRFVEQNAKRLGMALARNQWICTMRMAQRVPLGRPYRLTAVAERLDVPVNGSHRALSDCRTTLGVYLATRDMLAGTVSLAPLDEAGGSRQAEVAHDADLSGEVFVFTGFRDDLLARLRLTPTSV